MGMGIVSDKDFDSELSNLNPPPINNPTNLPTSDTINRTNQTNRNATIINIPKPGRKEGDNNVPDSLRKVIGEESNINGRQAGLEIAKQFGISPSSVSAYDNGARSTASYHNTPNASHNNEARIRVVKRARSKMMLAISHLTSDKIAESKARDIAGIAKDMAVVIKTMEPESEKEDVKQTPQFIYYAPQVNIEERYETIYAKE